MTKTRLALLVFCLALTIASAAHAATFLGGAGISGSSGGYGSQIVQWFVDNILSWLLDAVIIGAGLGIAMRSGHVATCAFAVVGLEIAVHYQDIHSLIG